MKLLLVCFFAISSLAFASSIPPSAYRDGTLISTPTVANCASTEGACASGDEFLVQSEGIVYTLTPLSKGERATLGWGKGFSKYSSLDNQLPGTPLKVRDDGRHFFVRVGNRESMYSAIETR